MPETFTLYRFHAADDSLLYVGLSINPGRRLEKHRSMQPWWPEVARIEMEQHPDLPTLRAAEREAIEAEKPLYNERMNRRARPGVDLVWDCEECHQSIADGTGYLAVNYADIFAHQSAHEEFEQELEEQRQREGTRWIAYSLAELPETPRARWRALHRRCDPRPSSNDYWFDIERIRTQDQALSWTAHLLGKNWLPDTDWDWVLRGLARVDA